MGDFAPPLGIFAIPSCLGTLRYLRGKRVTGGTTYALQLQDGVRASAGRILTLPQCQCCYITHEYAFT